MRATASVPHGRRARFFVVRATLARTRFPRRRIPGGVPNMRRTVFR